MKRPAIFFDRDNTLIISDGYLGDPAQVELVEGAAEAVARARAMGFAIVTFSNQSGVARGLFTEEAVHAVNSRLDDLLLEDNSAATIDRHEFCPYHPEAVVERYRQHSELRKPQPGMIHQAATRLDLDIEKSWVIGDAPRDIEAGHSAGCQTILLRIPSLAASPAAGVEMKVEPSFVATSLRQAMDIIQQHHSTEVPPAPSIASSVAEACDDEQAITQAAVDEQSPDAPQTAASPEGSPLQSSASEASSAITAVATTFVAAPAKTAQPTGEIEVPADETQRAQPTMTWGERMRLAREQKQSRDTTLASPPAITSELPAEEPDHSAAPGMFPVSHPALVPEPASATKLSPVLEPSPAPEVSSAPKRSPAPDISPIPDVAPIAHVAPIADVAPAPSPREASPGHLPRRSVSKALTPRVDPDAATPVVESREIAQLQERLDQILQELRRGNDHAMSDFSISKLMAGIGQVLVLAILAYAFVAFMNHDKESLQSSLLAAIALQTLTIALLIMGRQQ